MSMLMRLTAAGKRVLARGLIGEEIKFTKIVIGDGEFDYETESVYDLTEIKNWRMDLPLVSKKVEGDGLAYVEAYLSNAEVYDAFAAREHGLMAIDQTTGEEILYAYNNVGNEYDFIPNNTSSAFKNLILGYYVEIDDAENITAVIDLSVAFINTDDFQNHINAAHPHPNTPNHYGDVTSTSRLWATDEDNHLHKISVNNLKEVLRDDTAEVENETPLSDEEKIFRAKNELGLDANLLMVEDFEGGDDVTDNFKVRVTSSAENGSLLGLENITNLNTGAYYTISDGYNQEVVQIKSVRYNISGYHAVLFGRLVNAYDWNNTYLYRTTTAGADKKTLTWLPSEGFGGIEANIARTLELETKLDKADDFDISEDGALTIDGYFTLMW